MVSNSPPIQPIKSLYDKLFGGSGVTSFLEARFLPYILPFILGIVIALFAALLIIQENWLFLTPLVFLVPVVVLFVRYPFIAVLIWLLVFPFFVRDIVPGSRYMYWLLHRAMIPTALGIAALSELLRKDRKKPLRLGVGEVSMLLFLLLSVGNIFLLNQTPISSLIRFYDRIFVPFCMYGLIRLTAPNEDDLKRIAWIAPAIVIIQSTIGLLSWYAPGMLPEMWLNREGERTVGTFGNPGVFTVTLVFFSLFLFQFSIQAKSFWTRILCFSLIGLSLFSVFFSFSRGSWLGVLLVLTGLFFLYPRVTLRLTVVIVLILTYLGSTFFSDSLAFAWDRLTAQDSAEGRVIGGAASLRIIQTNPVFGVGFGNHELYDEQYRDRVLSLAVNNAQTSHNTFLLLMAEMGLVGFVLYMFPLVGGWLRSRKAWRKMPQHGFHSRRMLAMMWLLLLNHIAVSSFTDTIQSNLFGTTLWWLALGLIASLSTPYPTPVAAIYRRVSSLGSYGQEKTMAQSDSSLKQERVGNFESLNTHPPKTKYIFIVGVSRSGTTLMRQILNRSDRIAISRENHFLGHLIGSEGVRSKFRQFSDLSDDENVQKLVDFIYSGGLEKSSRFRGMSSHWRWIIRRVKREDFLNAILASDRSEKALFTVLMQLFADRKGKPIMGEKTPAHIRYVSTLLKWFPQAKVIHMLRDPRGVFVSELRRRYAESESAPYKQLKRIYPLFKVYILLQTSITWLDSVKRYHQNQKLFPDKYYLMKFEDLVREPVPNIRSLCDFLGVDFQQEMLEQSVVSYGFQLGQTGFDSQAADRWKKVIQPWSDAWFTFWFHKYLKEFGYDE